MQSPPTLMTHGVDAEPLRAALRLIRGSTSGPPQRHNVRPAPSTSAESPRRPDPRPLLPSHPRPCAAARAQTVTMVEQHRANTRLKQWQFSIPMYRRLPREAMPVAIDSQDLTGNFSAQQIGRGRGLRHRGLRHRPAHPLCGHGAGGRRGSHLPAGRAVGERNGPGGDPGRPAAGTRRAQPVNQGLRLQVECGF